MKHNSETICDDNGIEILVGYEYDETDGHYEEPGNVATFVEPTVYTELKSVEIVIAGMGIDILKHLTAKQRLHIINKLNYE